MCVSCCCVKFTLGPFVVLVAAASQLFQSDYVFGIQEYRMAAERELVLSGSELG